MFRRRRRAEDGPDIDVEYVERVLRAALAASVDDQFRCVVCGQTGALNPVGFVRPGGDRAFACPGECAARVSAGGGW